MKTLPVYIALFFSSFGFAQVPILERLVSIDADNKKTDDVLRSIEKQAEFSFSYKSSLVDSDKLVTVFAANRPVREVLRKMFSNTLQFKQRGEYLILTKANEERKMEVEGYVSTSDGLPVDGATVFDTQTLASASTNEYGYYSIRVKRTPAVMMEPRQLQVSKDLYRDTLVPIVSETAPMQNIVVEPERKDSVLLASLKAFADSTRQRLRQAGDYLWPEKLELKNVDDTLYRKGQLGVIPFVGTNGQLSGNVVNDWSLNMFGGYSFGTNGAEFASLFNISRSDVRWMQVAGLFNSSGANMTGFQAAGLANWNAGNTIGFQSAGLSNFTGGNAAGFMAAGLANVNMKKTSGFVVAGLANVMADTTNGFFAAGLANVNMADARGAQFAGLCNVSLGKVQGWQVAGLMNFAHDVRGGQLAVFNYSDSLKGVPIGIFSFVKSGYHTLEFSANDVFTANAALRSGVRGFYNIVAAGMKTDGPVDGWFNRPTWTYGYGIGSSPKLAPWLFLNIDLTSNYIAQRTILQLENVSIEQRPFSAFNLDNHFHLGAEFRIAKRFAIEGGPILHAYITERDILYPDFFSGAQPHFIKDHNWERYNLKMWIGWKVGLRLL